MPKWFVLTVAGAYGLVIGSFLNVVIHRLPRGMSLLRPRSHCPACGGIIAWYDNVPLLSFVLLRGRCRHCRAAIPVRYPLVELASGLVLVGVFWRFDLTVAAVEAALLTLLLLPLAVIDLEHHLLPDWLTIPGLAVGLLFSLARGIVPIADALVGAGLGALVPLLVIVIYRTIRGVEGMGLGDVKLLAMIGAFLGWRGVLLTLCLGACAGAAVGLGMIIAGRGRADTELPFGTFLAAAGAVTLFAGERLMRLLGWVGP